MEKKKIIGDDDAREKYSVHSKVKENSESQQSNVVKL